MNPQSFNISPRDFGFVVARALALVAWFHAALNALRFLGILGTLLPRTGYTPQMTPLTYALALMPGIVVLGLAFVGQRLWVEAPRFGGEDKDGGAPVTLSRIALLQGFTAAMGIYCSMRALIHLEPFAMSIVSPGPTFKAPASTGHDLYYAVIYGGFAIGLISWTARAGRPVDEREDAVDGTHGTDGSG